MTTAHFISLLGLSILAFVGVFMGLKTSTAILGAQVPRRFTLGISFFIALMALGFFLSSGQESGWSAWIWPVGAFVGISFAVASMRIAIRGQHVADSGKTLTLLVLVGVPLLALLLALHWVVDSHGPIEILLVPLALLGLSMAGRIWLVAGVRRK